MNTAYSHQESPLSRLLEDDNLTIIERIIPLCQPPLAKILAIQMKLIELQKIMGGFNDEPYLRACGFESSSSDMESVLRSLRSSVSEEKAQQIDSVLNIIQFSKVYQTWQETLKNHPELMQLFSQSFNQSSNNEKGAGMSSDTFTDPSLFFLLNSIMNNDEGNNDKIRELLSAFMKK